MRWTQGLKERLIIDFQGQEGIDAAGYFRKIVETGLKLNWAVYSKMVDG